MKNCRVVYLLPVGPGADDYIDTLESVTAWADPSRQIILIDDRGDVGAELSRAGVDTSDMRVVPAREAPTGARGGLWWKVAGAIEQALAPCRFEMLVRLDTDALLLQSGLEDAAAERFRADPLLGTLGGFRLKSDGSRRDFSAAGKDLRREAGLPGRLLGRPAPSLAELLAQADAAGYEDGEHVIACVQIWRHAALAAFAKSGWLARDDLARSRCSDDFIFGAMVRAHGFHSGDFGGPGQPLAVSWRGLPADPEEILARGTLATHSVRSWGGRSEADNRAVFAAHRQAAGRDPGAPARSTPSGRR